MFGKQNNPEPTEPPKPRVQYIGPRVQYIGPRVQYIGPRVQYIGPRMGLGADLPRAKLQALDTCHGLSRWIKPNNEHIEYSSFQANYNELSYFHNVGHEPLIGKTIGQVMDETTEKYPDREAYVFCRDGIRTTFAEFREEVKKLALENLCFIIFRVQSV